MFNPLFSQFDSPSWPIPAITSYLGVPLVISVWAVEEKLVKKQWKRRRFEPPCKRKSGGYGMQRVELPAVYGIYEQGKLEQVIAHPVKVAEMQLAIRSTMVELLERERIEAEVRTKMFDTMMAYSERLFLGGLQYVPNRSVARYKDILDQWGKLR